MSRYNHLINRLLFRIYAFDHASARNIILRTVKRTEGGEFYSKTVREIFSRYHNINIGMYSYGCFFIENIPPGTAIGRYCSFARNMCVLNGNHPLSNKSMHPFFYNPIFGYVDDLLITRTKLTIENDVWVGQNAIILPSVNKIENGAVIGAGSVVTQDVPPFAVVAGNPAKIIRYRFSKQIINKIIQTAWWNKDISEIKENRSEFERFLRPLE